MTHPTIRYDIADSTLGIVLVATSATGICAILLGEDAATLRKDLAHRFPNSTLTQDNQHTHMTNVQRLIEAPHQSIDLPLDVRGTPFQRKVWQALRNIPAGETASYTDIAKQVGDPAAVRAVAQACAANSIAIAIPCHRVVRSDGALSGYRWGVERKRSLLQREGAHHV